VSDRVISEVYSSDRLLMPSPHRFLAGANDKPPPTIDAPAAPSRPVFGVSLKDAVAASRIRAGLELPAVVYRCVEYLEAKARGFFRSSFRPVDPLSLHRTPNARRESSASAVVPTLSECSKIASMPVRTL
jgi:hypothetical protein